MTSDGGRRVSEAQGSSRVASGEGRPPVAILCGGRGTRLRERTQEIPKPLVEIGGLPIVWHVIQLYAVQGSSGSCSPRATRAL